MKKTIFFVFLMLFMVRHSPACVGKVISIGAVDSAEGRVLAEVLSSLINERTGSSVALRFYPDARELEAAVNVKQVDISIENTGRAMQVLNRPAEHDAERAYAVVKAAYEKEKGLVWLKPFGFMHGKGAASPSYTAAVLRVDVLNNFPALPRVIGKLGSVLNDDVYAKLLRSVESGEEPKKAARDFLRSKKLI